MDHYLIYLSYESIPFTRDKLIDLLAKSRENNHSLGVTGMLVYLDGKFLQVLEGPKSTVKKLYEKISLDDRHKKIAVLLEGPLEKRNFQDWSMGFASTSYDYLKEVTGLKSLEDFFQSEQVNDLSHPALIFLKLFYKKNRPDFELL